jgi:hypothetical protein
LLRSGQRIVHVPAALVWHRSWRGPGENRRLSRAYGVGAGGYFTKYFLKGDLLSGWRFFQRFGVRSLHLVTGMARGDRRRVEEQSEYLKGLVEGAMRFALGGRMAAAHNVALEEERA